MSTAQERIQQYERAIYSTAYDASTVEDVIALADSEITAMARKGARRIIEARQEIRAWENWYGDLHRRTAAMDALLTAEQTENAKLRAGLKALAEHKAGEEPDNAVVEAFRILEDEQTELRDTIRAVREALMQGGQTDRLRWLAAVNALEVPR